MIDSTASSSQLGPLSVRRSGPPHGAPMLLLHGLGGSRAQVLDLPWSPRVADRPLIAPDLRGHGDSPGWNGELPGFERLTTDVLGALDDPAAGPLVLVGISLGAAVAVGVALSIPDRIAGIVLVRPAWDREGSRRNLEVFEVLADHLLTDDLRSSKKRFVQTTQYHRHLQENPAFALALLDHFDAPRTGVALAMKHLPAAAPCTPHADLSALRLPALVVAADADSVHPVDVAHRWTAALPGATLREVPPRYRCPQEHAQAVTELVEAFIVAVDGPDGSSC